MSLTVPSSRAHFVARIDPGIAILRSWPLEDLRALDVAIRMLASACDPKLTLMRLLSSSAGSGYTLACELDAGALRSSCIEGRANNTVFCG